MNTVKKQVLEAISQRQNESISILLDERICRFEPAPYHFHPEYELVLNYERGGVSFIGDSINHYKPGNFVLIGPDLPHAFKPEFAKTTSPGSKIKSIVIRFHENAVGTGFLQLPEAATISKLIKYSKKGVEVTGKTRAIITKKMFAIVKLNGLYRWRKLIEILQFIAESKEYVELSVNAITVYNEDESIRINEVLKYISCNFHGKISLSSAANIANMDNNSFSRFFKDKTRKTFTNYLTEYRIGRASDLLIHTDCTVAEVCYNCRFNNLSNFHRYFKIYHKVSPLRYKNMWRSA